MKKILYFGASSSKKSINHMLAEYAAHKLQGVDTMGLRLMDYEMPIYSIDREEEDGIHPLAVQFKNMIDQVDGIIISFAEHNGNYTAAFKNIYDWISRIDRNIWGNKPLLLLATSPGARGGKTVLELAVNSFSFSHQHPILSFSLPSFYKHFSIEDGIQDPALFDVFHQQLNAFSNHVHSI